MYSNELLLWAFVLTLIAGLSTSIGAALLLTVKNPSKSLLSVGLGFSAGVMLYVSFIEILPGAKEELLKSFTPKGAEIAVAFAFFVGIGISALIDRVVPNEINPHEFHGDKGENVKNAAFFKKAGLITALAIAIHNFPEGFATFLYSLSNPQSGVVVAAAIALHNIPEGIAVALPVYMATKSHKKAFWLSFLSGFAEPLGAVVAFLFVLAALSGDGLIGIAFAAVAGIMVYVCLDELLPSSRVYGNEHLAILGVTMGMAIMATSLIVLG